METPFTFYPPRQRGLLFQAGVTLLLSLIATWLFFQVLQAQVGPLFLVYLLSALFLSVPIPVFAYRFYALLNSFYQIERDGIRLQWGFLMEDIPMTDISWIQLAEDFTPPLALPRIKWPGGIMGTLQSPPHGKFEFLASDSEKLIVIGTPKQNYVISVEDRNAFLQTFQRQLEFGSLAPLPRFSSRPNFMILQAWQAPLARTLLTVSLVFSLAIFIWVGLTVPNLDSISLGFDQNLAPLAPIGGEQLVLLPVINLVLLTVGYLLSIPFYRKSRNHPIAILLWISGLIMSILFLIGLSIIL